MNVNTISANSSLNSAVSQSNKSQVTEVQGRASRVALEALAPEAPRRKIAKKRALQPILLSAERQREIEAQEAKRRELEQWNKERESAFKTFETNILESALKWQNETGINKKTPKFLGRLHLTMVRSHLTPLLKFLKEKSDVEKIIDTVKTLDGIVQERKTKIKEFCAIFFMLNLENTLFKHGFDLINRKTQMQTNFLGNKNVLISFAIDHLLDDAFELIDKTNVHRKLIKKIKAHLINSLSYESDNEVDKALNLVSSIKEIFNITKTFNDNQVFVGSFDKTHSFYDLEVNAILFLLKNLRVDLPLFKHYFRGSFSSEDPKWKVHQQTVLLLAVISFEDFFDSLKDEFFNTKTDRVIFKTHGFDGLAMRLGSIPLSDQKLEIVKDRFTLWIQDYEADPKAALETLFAKNLGDYRNPKNLSLCDKTSDQLIAIANVLKENKRQGTSFKQTVQPMKNFTYETLLETSKAVTKHLIKESTLSLQSIKSLVDDAVTDWDAASKKRFKISLIKPLMEEKKKRVLNSLIEELSQTTEGSLFAEFKQTYHFSPADIKRLFELLQP